VASFGLRPFTPFTNSFRETFIAKRLAAHPPLSELASRASISPGMLDANERTRYTEDRERYEADLRKYLPVWEQWLDRESRTAHVTFRVENIGRVPATDVSVELIMPLDVGVWSEKGYPTPPTEPRPPGPPGPMQPLTFLRSNASREPYEPRFGASEDQSEDRRFLDPTSYLWRAEIVARPSGIHVTQTFHKIQQARQEDMEPLVLVLAKPAHSFEIRYRLHADNMDPKDGTLPVVVKEIEKSTEQR